MGRRFTLTFLADGVPALGYGTFFVSPPASASAAAAEEEGLDVGAAPDAVTQVRFCLGEIFPFPGVRSSCLLTRTAPLQNHYYHRRLRTSTTS